MIYICYSRGDLAAALFLTQRLRQKGVEPWLDVEKMLAGEPETVRFGTIDAAESALICIGPTGVDEQQSLELEAILNRKATGALMVVVVLLPHAGGDNVPRQLMGSAVADFRNGLESEPVLVSLLGVLESRTPDESLVPEAFPTQQAPDAAARRNVKAVSIILCWERKILLLQRAESQKSGGGLWQLPGGKVEEGESPSDAAIREIDEEAGLLLAPADLTPISEVVDKWLVGSKNDFISMSLFVAQLNSRQVAVAPEFKDSRWVPIDELFHDQRLVLFGSTGRYLRIARRYLYLHKPLREIAERLERAGSGEILPHRLTSLGIESTQITFALLSLLGFLDDRKGFAASSTMSAGLIRMLSEWALTESAVFEAEGDHKWYEEVERKGDTGQVARFREGLFDHHKSLLGLLSHRLPKALSTRYVCDVVLTGYVPSTGRIYVLIRWDFLARKFQMPAKGLEDAGVEDATSVASAQFVINKRLRAELSDYCQTRYVGKVKTSHVSAGSLGDGPIARNFVVTVFDLLPTPQHNSQVIASLNAINDETAKHLAGDLGALGDNVRRDLLLYVWADLDLLETKPRSLVGKKLQGYEEIVATFGRKYLQEDRTHVELTEANKLPIISMQQMHNFSILNRVMTDV